MRKDGPGVVVNHVHMEPRAIMQSRDHWLSAGPGVGAAARCMPRKGTCRRARAPSSGTQHHSSKHQVCSPALKPTPRVPSLTAWAARLSSSADEMDAGGGGEALPTRTLGPIRAAAVTSLFLLLNWRFEQEMVCGRGVPAWAGLGLCDGVGALADAGSWPARIADAISLLGLPTQD